MAGYSGTPLARKLGIKPEAIVGLINPPTGFVELLDPVPEGVEFRTVARGRFEVCVAFFTEKSAFEKRLPGLAKLIFPNGGLWIAWPKKASKVATTMTEDIVRDVALPMGLVDNKVCAIDDTWSGLRIVWRKELRS